MLTSVNISGGFEMILLVLLPSNGLTWDTLKKAKSFRLKFKKYV